MDRSNTTEIFSTMSSADAKSTSMPPDREALSLMTKLKLDRFKLRKMKFEEEYTQIMVQKNDSTISLLDKIHRLSKSIQTLFGEEGKQRYLTNFDALLSLSKANTSTSDNLLENFYQQLMKIISGGKRRSEYNYLFGLIMSQWLSGQRGDFTPGAMKTTDESLATSEELQKIIFDRPSLDLDQWRNFLQTKLFAFFEDDPKLKTAFDEFKLATEKYNKTLLTKKVSSTDVRRAIDSHINDSALDTHRKQLLIKMRFDENAINEFASCLTLMISDLSDWKWPLEGVRGIFRRNLVGKYRCYYEEDFLTAIFLEHIGLQWSYHFKQQLKILFAEIIKKSRKNCSSKSIQYERLNMQEQEYWMAALPDEVDTESGAASYANIGKLDLKTKLFFVLNTEIQLHQVLHPNRSFTVVSADLEWFGPSISHEIVHIFLEFCGISQVWLDFFDRFLQQPIYYKPGELIRQRQRGVPISHSLSHLFSELLLFGLDLYVYQNTGIYNYRMHDDFWFFHSDSDKIEQAWTLMSEFLQMTGLKFNKGKCGSVQIQPSNVTSDRNTILPRQDVKWGLLTLQSSGRFVIDRQAIIPFLDEMRVRLGNASTILEWVEIYNQYISFFMRNCGECGNILGTYHVEQMIQTFQFLHRYVFAETNGNALTVLTTRIFQQFPACLTEEICEAWCYWPLIQGGLGLKNIYLTLNGFHQCLLTEKIPTFHQLPARDAEKYASLVEEYNQMKKHQRKKSLKDYLHDDGTLISFDEYIQDRETYFSHWTHVYIDMLQTTHAKAPITTDNLEDWIEMVQDGMTKMSSNPYRRQSNDTDSYIEWLVSYYGKQIESTFHQLDFIDSENLPIGLIMLMKTTKIDWNKTAKEQHE